jgi:hypothetical protein
LLGVFFFVTNSSGATWYDVLFAWPDLGLWLIAVCTLLLLTGVTIECTSEICGKQAEGRRGFMHVPSPAFGLLAHPSAKK